MNVFYLLRAIQRELNEEPGYPNASIQRPSGYLSITCQKDSVENQDFAELVADFETLCKKNNIPKLPNQRQYAQTREPKGPSQEAANLIKYEFFISAENFERLLVNEFPTYIGYRYSGSILRLANPDEGVMKPGAICLFPVVAMEDSTFMLRSAGCNITETISTQLAYYISKYIKLEKKPGQSDFYGHHMSPLISKILGISDKEMLEIAFTTIGIRGKNLRIDLIQEGGGFRLFKLREKYQANLVAMNPQAEKIYQRLAPVSHDELPHLSSMEVSVKTMMEKIGLIISHKKEAIKDEIAELIKEMEKLNATDYDNEESLQYNELQRENRELDISLLEQQIITTNLVESIPLLERLNELREAPIPTKESEVEKRKKKIESEFEFLTKTLSELKQSQKYISVLLKKIDMEQVQQQQQKEQSSLQGKPSFFSSLETHPNKLTQKKEDKELDEGTDFSHH
ncbi:MULTISPECIES: hypothetical protein [unclassified Legionella]|uniref:hypothetical protein n=1 Tax=unclassified Legionella TaxID=2622702 RepID=UPI003AF554C5